MSLRLLLLLLGLGASLSALGASPIQAEEFVDAQMSARYQALIAEFRCPKCLNTNLKGSDSPIAVDLRRAVARLLREGSSDQQIRAYLQERYGDFVLYNPPFRPSTWLLWFAPLIALLLGALVLRRFLQREPVELDDEQRAQVAQLLKEKDV